MNYNLETMITKARTPVNTPLTNISVAYKQKHLTDGALNFFPEVTTRLSTSFYYVFDKATLLRDDVRDKPILGKVDPTILAYDTQTFKCTPKQIILGLDEIVQSDLLRTGAPGLMDIKRNRAQVIAEKLYIHKNKEFARKFFNANAWSNVKTGGASSESGKDFIQFDDSASDPIALFDSLMTDMKRNTGRKPNKLGLGINVFNALKNHPDIVERVKYSASTVNPAIVNEQCLATVLGIEKIVVFDAIWNSADLGATEDMNFICDENSALLVYATNTPAIDVATAGYTFSWDMGIGQKEPIVTWDGEDMTYSSYIGGMVSFDMCKVCDDLGVFLKDAVSGN